jgi:hypothetical protein
MINFDKIVSHLNIYFSMKQQPSIFILIICGSSAIYGIVILIEDIYTRENH